MPDGRDGGGQPDAEPLVPSRSDAASSCRSLASRARARTAFHHIDPLSSGGRRRFLRRRGERGAVVEVLDGPPPTACSRAGAQRGAGRR